MWKPFLACLFTSVYLNASDLQNDLSSGAFDKVIKIHSSSDSNKAKFTVALAQLSNSLEKLQQGFYSYGLSINSRTMGIRNLAPLPENPNPEEINYSKFRKLLVDFHTSLLDIEKTVSTVNDEEFNLPLDLTKVRFDINQDGKYSDDESSLALFLNSQGNGRPINNEQLDQISEFDGTIDFDRSDLLWLKGYTQVLLGTTNLILAHDFQAPFDTLAHLLFPKVKGTPAQLAMTPAQYDDIADLIAAFHNARMPVIEPNRLKTSRLQLLAMVNCSKTMWESVLKETDNKREWLPSPKQSSVTGIQITQKMVDEWHTFLGEYQAILEGKKLVPHWRFQKHGINLKRVFEENSETDIILWATGHAALPYLEQGEITKDDLWRQLDRTFNGNFLGMSFFIN
jgi:hypothetical protein